MTLQGLYETKSFDNITHYHVNVASLKQIGNWLELLKKNNCYDNTRIIIVSDHGHPLDLPPFEKFEKPSEQASFDALLMVKDFDARGKIKTDNTFMTNADTIFLAKDGLDVSEENPFTHNKFSQQKENGINVYRYDGSEDWRVDKRTTRTQYTMLYGYHVKDNIFDESNWTRIECKEK